MAFLTAETLAWAGEYLGDPHKSTLAEIQRNHPDAAVLLDWITENVAGNHKYFGQYPSGGLPAMWEAHLAAQTTNVAHLNQANPKFLDRYPAKLLQYLECCLPPCPP